MRKDTGSVNPREGIVRALREHPEGLTLKDIAELTGSHRHTITKYVYELIGARVILERDVGAAKLCYLMETYMGKEAHGEGAMKGSFGFRQPWKGQVQLVALLVVLFLVPAGLIAAQGFGNSTVTDGMAVATDGMNGTDGSLMQQGEIASQEETNVTQVPQEIPEDGAGNDAEAEVPAENEALSGDEVVTGAQNATIDEPANETVPAEDANAASENNETEEEPVIIPEGNGTTEEPVIIPEENNTAPEENATVPGGSVTPPGTASIEIVIENPARITRGEEFTARVTVRNAGDGDAENTVLEWILPDGFEIVSGSASEDIGTIAAGEEESCEITIHSSPSTAMGAGEIKARVTYG